MLKKILYYINPINLFRKEKGDANMRAMHWINKISWLMFIVILVILYFKLSK